MVNITFVFQMTPVLFYVMIVFGIISGMPKLKSSYESIVLSSEVFKKGSCETHAAGCFDDSISLTMSP